ncbi:hypothetical protein CW713_02200, partial [Methanophagales archaeon]
MWGWINARKLHPLCKGIEIFEIERLCRSRNRDIRDRAMVIKLSSQMIPVPEITEQLKRVRSYVLR